MGNFLLNELPAYWCYTLEFYGLLGKEKWFSIPLCISEIIGKIYFDDVGRYFGFKRTRELLRNWTRRKKKSLVNWDGVQAIFLRNNLEGKYKSEERVGDVNRL